MKDRNLLLLAVTVVLLFGSVVLMATCKFGSAGAYIVFAVLFFMISCIPCAVCYHYDNEKENGINFFEAYPAYIVFFIFLFTTPYYALLYIKKEIKKR